MPTIRNATTSSRAASAPRRTPRKSHRTARSERSSRIRWRSGHKPCADHLLAELPKPLGIGGIVESGHSKIFIPSERREIARDGAALPVGQRLHELRHVEVVGSLLGGKGAHCRD